MASKRATRANRRKNTFAKSRGYGMTSRPNNCTCRNCAASPWGMTEVRINNRIRKLNKAREEVNAS